MKEIQPFALEDGTIIYVEVTDAERGGMQRVGRSADEDKKAAKRFTEALNHVKPAAETVLNAFKEMNTPHTRFGLQKKNGETAMKNQYTAIVKQEDDRNIGDLK